jgi:hypothetical protein
MIGEALLFAGWACRRRTGISRVAKAYVADQRNESRGSLVATDGPDVEVCVLLCGKRTMRGVGKGDR